MSQGLLDQARRSGLLLLLLGSLRIGRIEIRITAQELTRKRNDSLGVLGPPNAKVCALQLHLLQHEPLRCFVYCSKVDESVMAILTDPGCDDRIAVLEYAHIFAKSLQMHVQLLRQGFLADVLWDVTDVQLPFGLVVARGGLPLIVLFVGIKDLLSRLPMVCWWLIGRTWRLGAKSR